MAKTYKWSELITDVGKYVKGIPTTAIDAITCDKISAEIWKSYPWYDSQTTIANGLIPLVTGTQDYSPPNFIYRLLKVRLTRTDTSPTQDVELGVKGDLCVDLVNRSPYHIRGVSLQAAQGQLRLEASPQISSGTTWEIRGDFQLQHTKITATSQTLWFDDMHSNVAAEGLLYYYYKLSDDPRAGGVQKQENGQAIYAGQYAAFRAAIADMAAAEDFGGEQNLFPSEAMGAGRDSDSGLNIYP